MLWNPSLNSDNINDMKIMKRDIPLVWLITLLFIAVFASRQGATAQSKVLPYPSHLRASAKENLVILSWTDSPDTKGKYIVYRSDKIINAGNLSSSTRLGDISSGFSETPPESRTTPLPYFLMEDGVSGNTVLSQNGGPTTSRPVSSETEKAIAALLLKSPPVNTAMPATRILPEELSIPSGGEDYSLSLIVSERIVAKDWLAAIDQLRKYLSLNRSPKASARARFYLGEALAYSGSSRDSFFEFLSARDFYPIETKPWIEYVLSILQKG